MGSFTTDQDLDPVRLRQAFGVFAAGAAFLAGCGSEDTGSAANSGNCASATRDSAG
ncbi:hypothetical protein [Actinoplanes philippinensis]|uniref:hypothetical protein n=1 Tax=Actinoplanes philippinensis TaxID=35752 RepID=UPI0033CD3F54